MSRADIGEITEAADMECAFAIRREVFCVEQGVSAAEEFDGLDHECRTYLIRLSDEAVGTARVRRLDGGTVKIERMAVLEPHRGKGHGRALMRRMIADIRGDGVETVTLHAQCHAEEFYRRHGFTPEGAEFIEAGIAHVRMGLGGKRTRD